MHKYSCPLNNHTHLEQTYLDRNESPVGFEWVIKIIISFGEFLQNFKLRKAVNKILHSNKLTGNHPKHNPILAYDNGTNDLKQCPDTVIKMIAEYLYQKKLFD